MQNKQFGRWGVARQQDLLKASKLFHKALRQRSLDPLYDTTFSVIGTSVLAIFLFNIALIATTRRGRHAVWIVLETTLASACVLLLLGIVLGMPFGALYLIYRALAYLARSIASMPSVKAMTDKLIGS